MNNQRVIGHSGAIRRFGGILVLLPEHNLDYFFSFDAERYGTSACDIVPAFRKQSVDGVCGSYRRVT